ncbi:MAG TPA: Gfo/Idh/MocA family oxidoreductase, partial [Oscillatoriaceae cyanobacterium]
MRVAVIGAGRWGRNLVANLAALEALAIVADPDQRLRESLAGQYPGVPMVSDHRLALAGDWPAVAIATPAPTHYAIAREALEAGKDVFVEKPLTLSSHEAEALVALARDRGRVLMVGHLLLYQPAVRFLQRFLAEGGVGELVSLHQERLNLGQARAVENALWSLGVHDVAVLLHLIGHAPSEVQACGQAA